MYLNNFYKCLIQKFKEMNYSSLMLKIANLIKIIIGELIFSAQLVLLYLLSNIKVILIFVIAFIGQYIFLNFEFLQSFIKNVKITDTKQSSIIIFYISSSLAIYIFLFKERKDINKNFINSSPQHTIFLITMIVSLSNLFLMTAYNKMIVTLQVVNFSLYFFNIFLSFYYLNVYRVTTARLITLTLLLRAYIRHLKIKPSKFTIIWKLSISSILYVVALWMTYKNIYYIYVLLLIILVIYRYMILYFVNYHGYLLKYISNRVFSTNISISYVKDQLDKAKEVDLNNRINNYTNFINTILVGNEEILDDLFDTYNLNDPKTKKYLVIIYDNMLVTYKDIIVKNQVDSDIIINISRLIYSFKPVINYNGLLKGDKPKNLISLENEYSKIYCNILVDILYRNVKTTAYPSLFRDYFELVNTDLKEYKIYKNDFSIIKNSYNVETRLLSQFVLDNNVENITSVISLIVEKRVFINDEYTKHYLKVLILMTVKSIELMNNKLSGYLIKIISTNFKSSEINDMFEEMSEDIYTVHNNPSMSKSERRNYNRKTKSLSISDQTIIIVNGSSYKYCFYKTYLLFIMYNDQFELFKLKVEKALFDSIQCKICDDLQTFGFTKKTIDVLNEKREDIIY